MNINKINNKIYYYESVWRPKKNVKLLDKNGKPFPYPKEGKPWTNKNIFLERLSNIEKILEKNKKFNKLSEKKNCLLCNEKNISTKQYILNNIIWEDSLHHYIKKHNIKPSQKFIDFIFFSQIDNQLSRIKSKNKNSNIINLKSKIIIKDKKDKIKYVKLNSNQILILDALMNHGGYIKRYLENSKNKYRYRFSEHAGILDFKGNFLEKIIVSGKTNRKDAGDDEIFLPQNLPENFEYEYLFHTHPPTPKPGGRVSDGILYEFPSIGDILHFIDHYNDGKTIGSIVITPEGLYNIRKLKLDKNKININENKLFKQYINLSDKVQNKAIKKYTENFNTYTFYTKISQDKSYLNIINNLLKKFKLYIDFFPRSKDKKGTWVINSVYLPIYQNK